MNDLEWCYDIMWFIWNQKNRAANREGSFNNVHNMHYLKCSFGYIEYILFFSDFWLEMYSAFDLGDEH